MDSRALVRRAEGDGGKRGIAGESENERRTGREARGPEEKVTAKLETVLPDWFDVFQSNNKIAQILSIKNNTNEFKNKKVYPRLTQEEGERRETEKRHNR